MSKLLSWIFGGLVTILFALLGIEKMKGRKKDATIEKQTTVIKTAEKQVKIHEAHKEAVIAVVEGIAEKEKEQKIEEKQIEEANTDEEIIAIANDIVNRFNAK